MNGHWTPPFGSGDLCIALGFGLGKQRGGLRRLALLEIRGITIFVLYPIKVVLHTMRGSGSWVILNHKATSSTRD